MCQVRGCGFFHIRERKNRQERLLTGRSATDSSFFGKQSPGGSWECLTKSSRFNPSAPHPVRAGLGGGSSLLYFSQALRSDSSSRPSDQLLRTSRRSLVLATRKSVRYRIVHDAG